MHFYERLKSLRKEFNLTQEELGQKLGISAGAVGLYEQGRRNPDNNTLVMIATLFNVSIDYLLGFEESSIYAQRSKTQDRDITFDDFTYAMYNETKALTDDQKNALLNMAKLLRDSNNK